MTRLECGLPLKASVVLFAMLAFTGVAAAAPADVAGGQEPPPCPFDICLPGPPPPGAPPDPGDSFPRVVQQMVNNGVAEQRGELFLAADSPPADQWIWQIQPMCDVRGGDCLPVEFCASEAGVYMKIEARPIAQPGPSAPPAPPGDWRLRETSLPSQALLRAPRSGSRTAYGEEPARAALTSAGWTCHRHRRRSTSSSSCSRFLGWASRCSRRTTWAW